MPGRIPLESLAGIAWNPWPESNGITGRDHVESVAGLVWNLQWQTEPCLKLNFSAMPRSDVDDWLTHYPMAGGTDSVRPREKSTG